MSEAIPAIENTLKWEGGLSEDPNDPGGVTNFGLSQRTYPSLDIKNLTKPEAIGIYERDWWARGPYASILDQGVANKCFDMAVNMGEHEMTLCVQRAINDGGMQISVDGMFGDNTLRSLNAFHPEDILDHIRLQAEMFYKRIVAEKPSSGKFLDGWIARARS